MLTLFTFLLLLTALSPPAATAQTTPLNPPAAGVAIHYQLPTTGPLPQTYRVTLAIADSSDPHWLISTFVAGGVRTVTQENGGRFTDNWNGLDDNEMPVPPGVYPVRGVFMPAERWKIDGQYHSLIPQYLMAAGDSWSPRKDQDDRFPWLFGHDFGPITDVAVASNGRAGFIASYIENSFNPFLVDLNRPISYDQALRRYPSGGAAGGDNVACDGEMIWFASTNGGPNGGDAGRFLLRADRAWGAEKSSWGARGIWLPAPVTGLAAWKNPAAGNRLVYAALGAPGNKILVLDGDRATGLADATRAEVALKNPSAISLDAASGRLVALHQNEQNAWTISAVLLHNGLPQGNWTALFTLPAMINPTDMKSGTDGGIYVSDEKAGQVYRLDRTGHILHRFAEGHFHSGRFNPNTFMSPRKLAVWKDSAGQERLLILEAEGPGRISEWTPDGKMLRQWFLSQNSTNGYALDPIQPEKLYAVTHSGHLTGYRLDYAHGTWVLEDVWALPIGGAQYPRIVNRAGRKYIAFAGGNASNYAYSIYRVEGDGCIPSAGIIGIKDGKGGSWWRDANGDGKVQASEYENNPSNHPGYTYWGDQWLDDLSLTALDLRTGRDWLRLSPSGFDRFGNPIYDGRQWRKLLTDPVFAARARGSAPALRGGNEAANSFSDWARIVGTPETGFFIADASGPGNPGGMDTAGGHGSQFKLSHYAPDGTGGYKLQWRVGRKAWRLAAPGEVYATQQMGDPAYGIVGMEDSNGLYHLYSTDGFYLDTLMDDAFRNGLEHSGMYGMSGETWYGRHYLDRNTGQVLLLMGRAQYSVYSIPNWRPGFVRPLPVDDPQVTIRASDIALPTELALKARGGASQAKFALFNRAAAPPALDGSLTGWEGAEPISFGLDEKHHVDVRALYDPQTFYLHWHVRLPDTFHPADTGDVRRIFTHERRADTLSLYIQSDPTALPGEARAGDSRIVFGLVKDGGGLRPVALGMYPHWGGPGPGQPMTYASPVGREQFENVSLLADARLAYLLDPDEHGFGLTAAIPRADILRAPAFTEGLRTQVDFAATLGGITNFWWTNTAGLTNTLTTDEPSEARLYPGAWTEGVFR